MKILFLAPEVAPYVKTGGLGDVAKALPEALARAGHEVMTVVPRYASIPAAGLERLGVSIRLRFPFGDERAELLADARGEGHEVIFLDHPGFYGRPGLYADARGDYADNHRRFGFFGVGALAAAQALGFEPDVVHLNDWQCGLAALALKRGYAHAPLGRAKVVLTIHNLAYQGVFPKQAMDDLGLPWDTFVPEGLEFYDQLNFLKSGLAYADAWTTVSERYAEEILTPELGCQLDGFLGLHPERLTGILNGVDYSEWDPARDALLPARYGPGDLAGKAACKRALRERFGLPSGKTSGQVPLFGLVSRLTPQKGIELVLGAVARLLERPGEVVLLGSGDAAFEEGFRALRARFPERVGVHIGFDNALSHLVEAGSDFFLMPSRYEPCGLNQMYSLKYGTPPVVRATGGLDDTVVDADLPEGNGFKFSQYREAALLWAMDRARELYKSPERLQALRARGMATDFSWDRAAQRYEQLYARLLGA